jgi:hypothetical protein
MVFNGDVKMCLSYILPKMQGIDPFAFWDWSKGEELSESYTGQVKKNYEDTSDLPRIRPGNLESKAKKV